MKEQILVTKRKVYYSESATYCNEEEVKQQISQHFTTIFEKIITKSLQTAELF